METNKISHLAISIFKSVIDNYHVLNTVNQKLVNPLKSGTIEYLLYKKSWIDTVQWHYEDLIRDPKIDPIKGMELKRKIDASNQDRTDMVEYIDSFFLNKYNGIKLDKNAEINTESPAWAIDRLSILELKIYHMQEETKRKNTSTKHKKECNIKLDILLRQRIDLSKAIDDLLIKISKGEIYMKVYKQMKMYNDEELNPILYRDSKK
tara:strand:- start:9076 stop:9696 length:621 start_codon:yes stop_codon:yes gene_type:complete